MIGVLLPTIAWFDATCADDLATIGFVASVENQVVVWAHNATADAERTRETRRRIEERRERREKAIRNRRAAMREKGYSEAEIRATIARMPRG